MSGTIAIFGFLKELIGPLFHTIDELHTSEDEKLQAKNRLAEIETTLTERLLGYEEKLLDAKAQVIVAEAQGESWLQRNWRPLLMLTIVTIVANNYILHPYIQLFGGSSTSLELPDALWNLMAIGVGGYIAGRSAEKIAPAIADAIKGRSAKE